MFGYYFLKLLLRIFFENKDNIILLFFEDYFCSLNLVFSVFLMFFWTKKIENQTCFLCFPYPSYFSEKKKKKNRFQKL